jgi:hypothetical protein
MIPALSIIMSIARPESRKSRAKAATLSRSPRSRVASSTPSNPSRASFAASGRRAGTTTWAPAAVRARVVSRPSPE